MFEVPEGVRETGGWDRLTDIVEIKTRILWSGGLATVLAGG